MFEKGAIIPLQFEIKDEASNTLKRIRADLIKTGDTASDVKVKFSDLTKDMAVKPTIFGAVETIGRYMAGGMIVGGLAQEFKNVVDTITDVETGVMELKKVMDAPITNFRVMRDAAVDMAKQYGVGLNDTLEAMKVFGQQGLRQPEVISMSRASVVAASVSDMKAAQATEYLTSATKQYGEEIQDAMRFVDSWINVDVKHAITAEQLAKAMLRMGSAAKIAGMNFHELNGVVTAVGSVTRQTGSEIGTSFRFILRNMQTSAVRNKLRDQLKVETVLPGGGLKPAFSVLKELDSKWQDLSDSQQFNIAQSVAGARHYNAFLTLMNNFDEAVQATRDSINSEGAAEYRAALQMDTLAAKGKQLRAGFSELYTGFGDMSLGPMKLVTDMARGMVGAFNVMPDTVKQVIVSLGGLAALTSKFDWLSSFVAMAGSVTGASGVISGVSSFMMEPYTSTKNAVMEVGGLKDIGEATSVLGKMLYTGMKVSDVFVGMGHSTFALLSNISYAHAILLLETL
jgi:TP901 family phage tail tape measure protein